MKSKEFLTELGYKGNIGVMEMFKFMQIATPEQKALMKQLIQDKKTEEAWKLLQDVTDTKLVNEYEQGTDNSKQIFSRLKELGYTKLGGGVDATVWSKEDGHVIKILMPSEDRETADNAFLFFYDICKDNQQNQFLPKFIDISGSHHSVFELNGTPYRQIAMERLQPIKRGSIEEALVWALSDLATVAFIKWRDVLKELNKPKFWEHYPYGNRWKPAVALLQNPQAEEYYHDLFSTMQDLYNEGRSAGHKWDLHTENVMQRGNGSLVITDPYLG